MLKEEQHMLSVAALESLAVDQELATSSIGSDRITYFLNLANHTSEQEFRDIIRDYRKTHKGDKTAGVRASEFQALYFGNLHGAALLDIGYHAAVKHSRSFLEGMGLRINGTPVLSDDEKQANRDKTIRAKAASIASGLVTTADVNDLAAEILHQTDIIKAAHAQTILEGKFKKVTSLVKSIMEDGDEYAAEVWNQLGKALGYQVEEETQQAYEGVTSLMQKAA